MMDWLYDTLIWTGILVALVLVLRRPVARLFGPRIAYALWAIPFIRLILPPIVLPAWMAPDNGPMVAAPGGEFASRDPATLAALEEAMLAEAASQQALVAPMFDAFWLTALTVTLWLGGAAIFLALRFKGYREMRGQMLDDAREVGRVGNVRLVETAATTSPLAFGVFDKVVALPPHFLAMHDRATRDLAVAHELAHHKGADLLVNIVIQPLFALHWFNPLGHYGWQALRRDQEAACDARVVAACPEEKRADYARVIASFAAGPNVALAAPMACPVLGEKSIIERLRSLKMSQHSSRRQKTGRFLLVGALVALPLTATVSYAEAQSVEEAFSEEIPAAPAAPEPPAPPAAPEPPAAPPAPDAPEVDVEVYEDENVKRTIKIVRNADGTVEKEEEVMFLKDGAHLDKEQQKKIKVKMHRDLEDSKEARAEAMKEMRIALAEVGDIKEITEQALKQVQIELKNMDGHHTLVEMKCEGDDIASEKTREDGTKVVMICKSKVMAEALSGLKEARAEIAQESDMDAETRAEVLRALDKQIENWDS